MAPFLVAAFDIECTARRLPRARQGREDGARDGVIWAGEQMSGAQGEGLDDMETRTFLADFRRVAGACSARSTPRRPGHRSPSCTASTSRTTHNIIGSKLSNTEKIERLAELLNKCALDRAARRCAGDDPDRPHRQPHRQPRGG
jgi:hypothetical protein